MIEIPLTRGYVAMIDDEDAHLSAFKWHAKVDPWGVVYARRNKVGRGQVLLHREVLGLKAGDPPVDHKNGIGTDCRRVNLRLTDAVTNQRNRGGPRSDNTSGHVGVIPNKRRGTWIARIKVNGVTKHLGDFREKDDAARARLAGEKLYWGIEPRRAAAHGAEV